MMSWVGAMRPGLAFERATSGAWRCAGLKVPEGQDRRELYKSQYRAIYTYKMSAQVWHGAQHAARGAPPSLTW